MHSPCTIQCYFTEETQASRFGNWDNGNNSVDTKEGLLRFDCDLGTKDTKMSLSAFKVLMFSTSKATYKSNSENEQKYEADPRVRLWIPACQPGQAAPSSEKKNPLERVAIGNPRDPGSGNQVFGN